MTQKILINIDVDRMAPALEFYKKAFGLRIGRRFDGRFIELVGASTRIYLLQENKGSRVVRGRSLKRNYSRHWTPIHLDWIVSDIEKSIRTAVEAGAKLEGRIRRQKYGKLATLSDPFGHGFCFIQFSKGGYNN